MLLSIIIPVYNSADTLEYSINSILNQDLNVKDYEVIFVNDGSIDNSKEIILKYNEKFNNFKYLEQNNKGPGAARNLGLSFATGDYIYFMDADDYLAPYLFGKFIKKHILLNTYYHIFIYDYKIVDSFIKENYKDRLSEDIEKYNSSIDFMTIYGTNLILWRCIIKRSIIIENNIFFPPLYYAEDWIFLLKLLKLKNIRILKTKDSIYRYYYNPFGISHNLVQSRIEKNINSLYEVRKILETLKKSFPDNYFNNDLKNNSIKFFIYILKGNFSLKKIEIFIIKSKNLNLFPILYPSNIYEYFINLISQHPIIVKLTSILFKPSHRYIIKFLRKYS